MLYGGDLTLRVDVVKVPLRLILKVHINDISWNVFSSNKQLHPLCDRFEDKDNWMLHIENEADLTRLPSPP